LAAAGEHLTATASAEKEDLASVANPVHYYNRDRSVFLDWVGGEYKRVLDVGCGAGSGAAWYRRHGAQEVVGVEVDDGSAAQARLVLDRVVHSTIESAFSQLGGTFDLIVCADVLEHLLDPWAVIAELAQFATLSTVLAISMPNIRFVPAILRIALGRGFDYENQGIFDKTHLRFFTRGNVDTLLVGGGWLPARWGGQHYGRLRTLRALAGRLSRGRSDEWMAEQLFVAGQLAERAKPERPSVA
jgi:SAM-dependent methyltransferase